MRTEFALLRGVCQIPAYAAYEKGFFAAEGLEATLHSASTASPLNPRRYFRPLARVPSRPSTGGTGNRLERVLERPL